MVDWWKAFTPYFQPGPLSEISPSQISNTPEQSLNLRRMWVQTIIDLSFLFLVLTLVYFPLHNSFLLSISKFFFPTNESNLIPFIDIILSLSFIFLLLFSILPLKSPSGNIWSLYFMHRCMYFYMVSYSFSKLVLVSCLP